MAGQRSSQDKERRKGLGTPGWGRRGAERREETRFHSCKGLELDPLGCSHKAATPRQNSDLKVLSF